jgi:NTP pyrophosphatase (non-canonical NTP hydrolase)
MDEKLNQLLDKIKKFRDERDWKQFHNHKDMAISIVLEASELLEHFQWKTSQEIDETVKVKKEELEEEVADILIYLLELSDNIGIDIVNAVEKKLKKNEMKYPVEKTKGTAQKYNRL